MGLHLQTFKYAIAVSWTLSGTSMNKFWLKDTFRQCFFWTSNGNLEEILPDLILNLMIQLDHNLHKPRHKIEMCKCGHVSITEWCTVGCLPTALLDLWNGSIIWCKCDFVIYWVRQYILSSFDISLIATISNAAVWTKFSDYKFNSRGPRNHSDTKQNNKLTFGNTCISHPGTQESLDGLC